MDRLVRALVAEDSRITRILLCELLRENGVEVVEASDGRQALELALKKRPQLLILDGLMPVYSAFDVLAKLQSGTPDYRPKVFIITALFKSRRWESEARTKYNVGEYLEKPLEPADLLAAIGRHFRLEATPAP